MEFVILSILGLAVGSFLNVLIYRLNTDDKVPKFWQGRSLCPKCKHELSWQDNIPLVSFVVLGRRCRHCRTGISWQYPTVEFLTAAVTVTIAFIVPGPLGINLPVYVLTCLLAYCFIVIFFSDLIYGLIPDEMIFVGSLAALFLIFHLSFFNDFSLAHWSLIENWKLVIGNFGQNVLVGFLSGLGFLAIVLATRFKGMGLGDVKLAFLMGFLLGWPKILVAFWVAFVLGGAVAIVLLLLKRVKFSATIPLGPFLVLGVAISALWSTQLLHLLGL